MAESLLKDLQQVPNQGRQYFLMGDELWFFYATDYERMWLSEGVTLQSRSRTLIPTPQVMISTFWSPLGFWVITALLPRTKFIAAYLCRGIILKIIEGMPFDLANPPRQLMFHMDNATVHRARELITWLNKC
jgi:hypothetical protein